MGGAVTLGGDVAMGRDPRSLIVRRQAVQRDRFAQVWAYLRVRSPCGERNAEQAQCAGGEEGPGDFCW